MSAFQHKEVRTMTAQSGFLSGSPEEWQSGQIGGIGVSDPEERS